MAEYTRHDSGEMRRDAQRRSQQMKQRVPHIRNSSEEEQRECTDKIRQPQEREQKSTRGTAQQLPFGIDRIFTQLDSDRMLILAILAMLYKDGGSKKLMMALAYLLT